MNPFLLAALAVAGLLVLVFVVKAYRFLRERHREGEMLKYWRRGPLE